MTYYPIQAVENARNDLGYTEGPNNNQKYTPWQTDGRYNYQAYCLSGACYWVCHAGLQFDSSCLWGIRGDWNVGSLHRWAERNGLWRSAGDHVRAGDLVILTWGIPDQHVGLCVADSSGGNVETIEANAGPSVGYHSRSRGNVVGFVALTQSSQVGPLPPAPPTPAPPPPPPPPRPKEKKVICFYTVPDHPDVPARGTVWMSDGFFQRGMHNQEELAVWQFIAASNGAPHTNVGTLPYAVTQHIPLAH